MLFPKEDYDIGLHYTIQKVGFNFFSIFLMNNEKKNSWVFFMQSPVRKCRLWAAENFVKPWFYLILTQFWSTLNRQALRTLLFCSIGTTDTCAKIWRKTNIMQGCILLSRFWLFSPLALIFFPVARRVYSFLPHKAIKQCLVKI